jgi:DMSO/TMAO reductase YedYZ molybdopterin-dependent catalytic subunit
LRRRGCGGDTALPHWRARRGVWYHHAMAITGGTTGEITREELQLAARNHGMPLECLRDPITPVGLHYLLIHYDVPVVDGAAWSLTVGGHVARPLALTLEELQARPAVTRAVTMECAGNGRAGIRPRLLSQPWLLEAVGTAEWTGVPVRDVLAGAGVLDGAVEVLFRGLDRGVEGGVEQCYERSLPLQELERDEVILAYAVNGQPLPPQHGFPLRLVVPGWYGMTSVKWLSQLTVLTTPFAGYQHTRAYRMRASEDDPGVPVTRMMPRSLMVPPGIPDFFTRRRHVPAGEHLLEGRAWSGWAPIERVQVSADAGASWTDAELGEPAGPDAWRGWSLRWAAAPGEHVLCCRAEDGAGNVQPLEAPWNPGGYANNAVQRVVTVVG